MIDEMRNLAGEVASGDIGIEMFLPSLEGVETHSRSVGVGIDERREAVDGRVDRMCRVDEQPGFVVNYGIAASRDVGYNSGDSVAESFDHGNRQSALALAEKEEPINRLG